MGGSSSTPTYDVVIAGGGTSGLLLGVALSANPNINVAVVEAGGDSRTDPRVTVPENEGSIANTEYDWKFNSVPQTHLYNRPSIGIARGKTVGGTSAMNWMIWHRASQVEFDAWESVLNISGWNWASLYPAFKASETFQRPPSSQTQFTYNDNYHGFSGPVAGSYPRSTFGLYTDYVLPTLQNLGVQTRFDSDGGNITGARVVPLAVNQTSYTRSYAGTAYTNVQSRPNLKLLTNSTVSRILWNGTSNGLALASGVEYVDPQTGKKAVVNAKNVVVSAGAIQSPQLLELSGVGDPTVINPLGINTVVNLPAVGTQEQDHMTYGGGFGLNKTDYSGGGSAQNFLDYAPASRFLSAADYKTASQMLSSAAPPAGVSLASWQMLKKLWNSNEPMVEFSWYYAFMTVYLLHPLSQGTVHINSTNPNASPRIDVNFDSATVSGVSWDSWIIAKAAQYYATTVAHTSPLSKVNATYSVDYRLPFDQFRGEIIKNLGSGAHQTGGCVMMPRSQGGVVDQNLVVYGTKNVRVVDLSIVPTSPGQHVMGLAYAIAMRASSIISSAITAS